MSELKRLTMQKQPLALHIRPAVFKRLLRATSGGAKFSKQARRLLHLHVERRILRVLKRARAFTVHDAVRHNRAPTGGELLYPADIEAALQEV
jgi:histone H3/H4